MSGICLSMIVKNESKIIKNCLSSIADYLDYWIICDTGSTDDTQDIIKSFFKEKNIPGELYQDEWVDFGYNRTLAFKRAKYKAKYCFVIDADDLLIGKLIIPEGDFTSLMFKIRLGNLEYYRDQIFKNDLDWNYIGVVHEYACLVDSNITEKKYTIKNCSIKAGTFGDRSTNKSCKFKRDIKLLLNGIINEPNNSRYYFYLAQSYRDINDYKNAIKFYKKRVELGGWNEEVYYSLYMIGLCKQLDGLSFENEILYDYIKAYNFRKNRLESLYKIVEYYRKNKKYKQGYLYGILGIENNYPNDILFVDKDIHTYKFIEEMALCCYYVGAHKLAIELNNKILNLNSLDNSYINRIKTNLNYSWNIIKNDS